MDMLLRLMIYAGSALMVYNVIRCHGFVVRTRDIEVWNRPRGLLYVPLGLLVGFLVGYLVVGYFGDPDIVIAGILLGGSVFVYAVLGILYDIIDRLRESNASSASRYAEAKDSLDSLAKEFISVFRINLTKDAIEDRGGHGLYDSDLSARTYTELMDSRHAYLISRPTTLPTGEGLLTREGLLRCYAMGRRDVSETLQCQMQDGTRGFVQTEVALATRPGSTDVIAFLTERICNEDLVTDALLTKALKEQFDMITYLFEDHYQVLIGGGEHRPGSIFPSELSGSYERYVSEQVAPVVRGSEEERAAQLEALSTASVDAALAEAEPYEVNIACELDGGVFHKRFVFYVVDLDARFYLLLKSDTTDARREEAERNERLSAALAEAQRANTAKTTFLSNMSHDIRTPMNAIIGYTEFARKSDDEAQMHMLLDKIDASSKYLLALINDVLEMSRIESGRIDLESDDADLVLLMEGVHDMFESQMREKGVTCVVDTTGVRDRLVRCDTTRLNRVLLNLLSNAYKFTPAGGTVTVTLSQPADAQGGMATYELRVRDTGIGMSPEFAEHVFDAFERERNTTASGIQGTGLGMAITKRIVDAMGGTIAVHTEQGVGTEFVVTMPLAVRQGVRSEPVPVVADMRPSADEVVLEGRRALLAEDNEINREIASLLLEELGMELDEACNGRDAVDRLVAAGPGRYDVVITDIQMPVMNGYDEARAIRALDDPELAGIPIIAMSANAFHEDMAAARAAGIDGYVPKPVDIGVLMDELARVLS